MCCLATALALHRKKERRRERSEEIEIVIVGGGICGLATALALHRKGIESVVLERSESLRATGAAIGILANGWRALQYLGLASHLRHTAITFHRAHDIWLDTGKQKEVPISHGEARCLRRSDLLRALAESLPEATLRFGCQVISICSDPLTSSSFLHLHNGHVIKAKILIGCDGAHSVVADFIGLKPLKMFSLCAVRGFTNYPNGHGFPHKFLRVRAQHAILGRIPIDSKLVYWFLAQKGNLPDLDSNDFKVPELIQQWTIESTKGFPAEIVDMINICDLTSLSLTQLRYRPPWEILFGKFRKGTTMVAGDAMHVMGPFLGQGGSAGLEDAIVLARHLGKKLDEVKLLGNGDQIQEMGFVKKIGEAFDGYVEERRMRLVKLSLRSYVFGSLIETSSLLKKLLCVILVMIFFSDPAGHTYFDCCQL